MAPAYKLTYFNSRGLTEVTRFIFKYAEIDFEDVRIDHADWPALKPSIPNGQLPVLEHNGKLVGQSLAIARYAAKLAGLTGSDAWEELEINAALENFIDFRNKLFEYFKAPVEEKPKIVEKLNETVIPEDFAKFDAAIKKNNGHFVNGKLSWVDFYMVSFVPLFKKLSGEDVFKQYPNMAALIEKVHNIPQIKKWLEERPETEY